jgi:hypothetical protein
VPTLGGHNKPADHKSHDTDIQPGKGFPHLR